MSETRFRSASHTVTGEWIDFNGHMSMAYYPLLFETLGSNILDEIGLSTEYIRTENRSLFTIESHMRFLRELHEGDRVYSVFRYVDHDHSKLVYAQELHHEDGWLSATLEVLAIHVDILARKSAPFRKDTLALFEGLALEVRARPKPGYLGRAVGISRRRA
ncbi:thioesterase family protein [Bradyrhizobium sp. Arg314]